MVVVCVRGPLRKLAGERAEHALEGKTVVEVLQALELGHKGLSGWILDERGLIRRQLGTRRQGENHHKGCD